MININKQDRQGVRKASDIERKYDLGQDYSKIIKVASDAQKTAERASGLANDASTAVTELSSTVDALNERVDNISASSGGGYYSPSVTQPSASTMQVSYTPSVSSLPSVDPVIVALPKGENGEQGMPGISCTHEWNGTTLIVTSASGTSSADLKGDKGDSAAAETLTIAEIRAICT